MGDHSPTLKPREMFKRFTREEDVSSLTLIKTSKQRAVRKGIVDSFPILASTIDLVIPKKGDMHEAKCHNHVTLIVVDKKALFFKVRDGLFFPNLRFLHQYPDVLPKVRVDRGAIPFLMSGAHCMCPGLTHPCGDLPAGIPEGTIVAIHAEGKQHALGIGIMKMSSEQIRATNKGIGIELVHYIGDGLWKLDLN
eukprot:TRINITY_DN9453_c0_g1_i2.p1 TRINITY_DN9453_c0_g1~~TRINITY_DN9453_c0_g1_i2.p1  ORF type:complete len:203 (+),score=66.69 TRINITY_DN9453_c0_g1_i2:30-611(+)